MASLLWTLTILVLPFIEESIYPSGADDSWQRGIVFIPILFIPATIVFSLVTKYAMKRGNYSYLSFLLSSSFLGILVFIGFGTPAFVVSAYIQLLPPFELILVSSYLCAILYITLLIPLSLWWLIAARRS